MLFFYILVLAISGIIGVVLNAYLLWKFSTSKNKPINSFHKFCLVKTIPNLTITAIFAFWMVPLSVLQTPLKDLPRIPNVIFGLLLGQYCYLLEKCFFIFEPQVMFFHYDCPDFFLFPIFRTIVIVSSFSNIVNLLIFAKLLKDKVSGMNANQMSKRNKTSVRMYIQNVLQDILQVIDVINWTIVANLIHEFWWQFIFYCWFFEFIYVLDGMIMMYFNPEVNIVNMFQKRVAGNTISDKQSRRSVPVVLN